MADILKKAIAQAKVLKEVAVENAKATLLESFEPRIQSLLSTQLTNEIEGDEELPGEDIEDSDEFDTEDPELSETEDPGKNAPKLGKTDSDVTPLLNEDDDMDEDDLPTDDTLPVEGLENEVPGEDEEDLEFESILKELDDEMTDDEFSEDPEEELPTEGVEEELPEEDETEEELPTEGVEEELPEEDDEEINISELLEDEDMDEDDLDSVPDENELTPQLESLKQQNSKLKKQLKEATKANSILMEQIGDINMLNHKLVHAVKLFRNFNLSNDTKMKVVETFDRAKSPREIKLIYTTLYESLKNSGKKRNKTSNKPATSINEVKNAGASKTVIGGENFAKSTILSEGSDLEKRFAKLANIKQ